MKAQFAPRKWFIKRIFTFIRLIPKILIECVEIFWYLPKKVTFLFIFIFISGHCSIILVSSARLVGIILG